MREFRFIFIIIFCVLCTRNEQAQHKYSTLIQSSNEDEIVVLSLDKPVYYPGDTVSLTLKRNERNAKVIVTPVLIIEGVILKYMGHNLYSAAIPEACTPGQYKIILKVLDSEKRRFVYDTDCSVAVEEHQIIEQVEHYVSIAL